MDRVLRATTGHRNSVLWVIVWVSFALRCSLAETCNANKKTVCIKTVREPYYQKICSNKVACTKIEVPCGPADDPFPCAFDELCVTHQTNCSKETDEEAADKEKAKNCTSAYSCEWRPYWDLDLNLFSARCTEYYTLQKNQTCGDAMAKFFLPWKVFAGFNPEIDCKKAEEGDKVCVHAYVEPRKPVCGKQRCKLGEKCIHTECAWKPRFGDRCGSVRCPPGYACQQSNEDGCKKANTETYGEFYFEIKRTANSTSGGKVTG